MHLLTETKTARVAIGNVLTKHTAKGERLGCSDAWNSLRKRERWYVSTFSTKAVLDELGDRNEDRPSSFQERVEKTHGKTIGSVAVNQGIFDETGRGGMKARG